MTIKWRCTLCGACCKNYTPFVLPEDIKRIQEATGRPLHTFLTFYPAQDFEGRLDDADRKYFFRTRRGPLVMCLSRVNLANNEAGCVFLKDNLCSIHASRPQICHQYPFRPEDYNDISGPFRLMDNPCFDQHAEDEIVTQRPLRENYRVFHTKQEDYLEKVEAWNEDPESDTKDIEDFLLFVGLSWGETVLEEMQR